MSEKHRHETTNENTVLNRSTDLLGEGTNVPGPDQNRFGIDGFWFCGGPF
jgi:hypothetical protein